jgi:hypothetical protein
LCIFYHYYYSFFAFILTRSYIVDISFFHPYLDYYDSSQVPVGKCEKNLSKEVRNRDFTMVHKYRQGNVNRIELCKEGWILRIFLNLHGFWSVCFIQMDISHCFIDFICVFFFFFFFVFRSNLICVFFFFFFFFIYIWNLNVMWFYWFFLS